MAVTKTFDPIGSPIPSKECAICQRAAVCFNYGVLSCDACKMFFRRCHVEKKWYKCRKENRCLENVSTKTRLLCRGCRIQKCFAVGMKFEARAGNMPTVQNVPEVRNGHIPEVLNQRDDTLIKLLISLTAKDSNLMIGLMHVYSKDDKNLAIVWKGIKTKKMTVSIGRFTSPDKWSLFHTYIQMTSLMNFSFVDEVSFADKIHLFQKTTVRMFLLGSAMFYLKNQWNDVQVTHSEDFENPFAAGPDDLKRAYGKFVTRVIQLKVSREEFVMLQILFFCNPTLPLISPLTQAVLIEHNAKFSEALFKHCQLYYRSAPARVTELLSLYTFISENYDNLNYKGFFYRHYVSTFPFRTLKDTFGVDHNMNVL